MFIKVYLHYNSLKSFNKGEWVLPRIQFVSPEDIELLVNIKDVVFSYQQSGFTMRKKKWYERLFKFKSIK